MIVAITGIILILFRNRTFAWKFADFYRTGLDQWLLGTSAKSRAAPLVDPNFSPRHGHYSHLRDHPIGN